MSERPCPLCKHAGETILFPQLESGECETVLCVMEHRPEWQEDLGICELCWDHYKNLVYLSVRT